MRGWNVRIYFAWFLFVGRQSKLEFPQNHTTEKGGSVLACEESKSAESYFDLFFARLEGVHGRQLVVGGGKSPSDVIVAGKEIRWIRSEYVGLPACTVSCVSRTEGG